MKASARKEGGGNSKKIIQKLEYFLNRISKKISPEEAEILNHIYGQGKSLEN